MVTPRRSPCGGAAPIHYRALEAIVKHPRSSAAAVLCIFVGATYLAGVVGAVAVSVIVYLGVRWFFRFSRDIAVREYHESVNAATKAIQASAAAARGERAYAYHFRAVEKSNTFRCELSSAEELDLLSTAIDDVQMAISLDSDAAFSGRYPGNRRLPEAARMLENLREKRTRLQETLHTQKNESIARRQSLRSGAAYLAVAAVALVTRPSAESFEPECRRRLSAGQPNALQQLAADVLVTVDCQSQDFKVARLGFVQYELRTSGDKAAQYAIGAFGKWWFIGSTRAVTPVESEE